MALTNWADYRARLAAPDERVSIVKNSITVTAGRVDSMWTTGPFAGAAPSTAAVPTRATTGAVGQRNPSGLRRILQRIVASNAGPRGTLLLVDRLSHQGGLVGNVATAQTTNLPTAALTRYTDGVGVMLGLEFYTAIGTTATTVSASYTNQDGTSGQTTPLTDIGTTTFGGAADRLLVLPLAAGDYGVRAVASVTLTATTGTAGNFGVTLFRPLLFLPLLGQPAETVDFDAVIELANQMPEIQTNACLAWAFLGETTSQGVTSLELFFSDV